MCCRGVTDRDCFPAVAPRFFVDGVRQTVCQNWWTGGQFCFRDDGAGDSLYQGTDGPPGNWRQIGAGLQRTARAGVCIVFPVACILGAIWTILGRCTEYTERVSRQSIPRRRGRNAPTGQPLASGGRRDPTDRWRSVFGAGPGGLSIFGICGFISQRVWIFFVPALLSTGTAPATSFPGNCPNNIPHNPESGN